MESLVGVLELKPEPVSPLNLYEDAWLLDETENLTAFKLQPLKNENVVESKGEVYSKLLEDLDQLDQLEDFIKEESFSNWLEEKVDLPIFDDIRIEPRYIPITHFKNEDKISQSFFNHELQQQSLVQPFQPLQNTNSIQVQKQDTNMLLQEFETVYGAVEMTHGQLTPPQSPPLNNPQPQLVQNTPIILTQLTPISFPQNKITLSLPVALAGNATLPVQVPVYFPPSEVPPATPQPDVAHELAVVDELVRTRAENLFDSWDQPAPSSPCTSSSSGYSECSSDQEWIPDTVQNSATNSSPLVERPGRGRKRAGKPYAKAGPEDKKYRKKEQNKNAATRYRLKKKAEIEEILSEEKGLLDTKGELINQVSDLQREIKCLKGLMRDLFKAKGLIN